MGQTRKFTVFEVSKMRKAGLQLAVKLRLPLKFFDQPEVVQYIHSLLEIFGQSSNGVKQLLPSARTLKRYATVCATEAKNLIKSKVHTLAADGRLGISIDHKRLSNKTGETSKDAIGVQLTYTDNMLQRHHYLIGFQTCALKSDLATIESVKPILKAVYFRIM